MIADWTGAIDCDFHPRVPMPRALSRYMDEHWRSAVETRGIEFWETIAYPANSPLALRPDWREAGADTDPAGAAQATLDRYGFAHAIPAAAMPGPRPAARRGLPVAFHVFGASGHAFTGTGWPSYYMEEGAIPRRARAWSPAWSSRAYSSASRRSR